MIESGDELRERLEITFRTRSPVPVVVTVQELPSGFYVELAYRPVLNGRRSGSPAAPASITEASDPRWQALAKSLVENCKAFGFGIEDVAVPDHPLFIGCEVAF